MAKHVYLATLLLTIGFSILSVKGLTCYSCTLSIGDADKRCQYDPHSVNTTSEECLKKYCVTKRVEYLDPKDGELYLSRTCEDDLPILNGSVEGKGFTTHYQACTTDLCNIGDGTRPASEFPDLSKTFTNRPCEVNGRGGVCKSAYGCYLDGGINIGRCTYRTGICCMFQYTCGQMTTKRQSYFISSNQYTPYCTFTVEIQDRSVSQVRLDFNRFSLAQPDGGSISNERAFFCEKDRFAVASSTAGPGGNLGFQYLCGENSGQHIYVPVDATTGYARIDLIVQTNNNWMPAWEVGVRQLDCSSSYDVDLCAPQGCLQYYPSNWGTFESFNFPGGSYLGNLNYAICFKRSNTACGMHFTPESFSLATDDLAHPYGDEGCSQNPGSGTPSYDYLLIPDGKTDDNNYYSKYCGQGLSPSNGVTSSAIGYPYVIFRTDELRDTVLNGEERGFRFHYQEVSFGCRKTNA